MKKYFIITLLSFSALSTFAQQKAITDTGEEVVLYEDGTWEYAGATELPEKEIPVNPKPFVKSGKSSFLLKSSKTNLGVWIDPKKWTYKKAENNEDAEYELNLKGGDLYGMIITEKIEIPLKALKQAAFNNAKQAAPDIKIVHEEMRKVNGTDVLFMQMEGTLQDMKFIYFGYYFSNSKGAVQFLTYTTKNLEGEYKASAEELLNGLVEL